MKLAFVTTDGGCSNCRKRFQHLGRSGKLTSRRYIFSLNSVQASLCSCQDDQLAVAASSLDAVAPPSQVRHLQDLRNLSDHPDFRAAPFPSPSSSRCSFDPPRALVGDGEQAGSSTSSPPPSTRPSHQANRAEDQAEATDFKVPSEG